MLTRRSLSGRRCATHARDRIASFIRLGLARFSSHLSASSAIALIKKLSARFGATRFAHDDSSATRGYLYVLRPGCPHGTHTMDLAAAVR